MDQLIKAAVRLVVGKSYRGMDVDLKQIVHALIDKELIALDNYNRCVIPGGTKTLIKTLTKRNGEINFSKSQHEVSKDVVQAYQEILTESHHKSGKPIYGIRNP